VTDESVPRRKPRHFRGQRGRGRHQDLSHDNKRARYVLMFDPLDDSSNIDVNISIGTIFGVLRAQRMRRQMIACS